MTTMTEAKTIQVYRVYIRADARRDLDPITDPDWTDRYGYGGRAQYELRPGGSFGFWPARGCARRRARSRGGRRGHRSRPAAQTRPDLAPRDGGKPRGRGLHPPDLRDRAAGKRRDQTHHHPRPDDTPVHAGLVAGEMEDTAPEAAGRGSSAASRRYSRPARRSAVETPTVGGPRAGPPTARRK